ncbi:D-alanyl-D-alanine carboxypeptidase family protein [Microbacterium cremeum]|uniref:D-alanyl-D-alanine carboxypeptidase family protein n=1 Tax=Microbacterium cremeum TaxID=2782169 RepID=UPI0018873A9A|nr:D-alanyl-D-alanine carboxypeptidase [Microbacterium cremeum]
MPQDDAPAPTRRQRRVQSGAVPVQHDDASESGILTLDGGAGDAGRASATTGPGDVVSAPPTVAAAPLALTATPAAPAIGAANPGATTTGAVTTGAVTTGTPSPAAPAPAALAWVDERAIGRTAAPGDLNAAASSYVTVDVDLLADAPRRSPLRAGVVVPTLVIAGLVAAYSGTTLLWPLHAVAPTVTAIEVQPAAASAAAPVWPAQGSAAVGVRGMGAALASSPDPSEIASITKVVTALVVLDEMPLAVGEQGPEYHFTSGDSWRYWQYRRNGESALDVPAGGSLTQYQMLEGMLIGSANNYADRLAQTLWPSDAVFASAAGDWLASRGVEGVTIVEPTGMDSDNAATPAGLITLAQKALENPVIAEIVAKPAVDLPGAGHVENTNGLLADAGVVGIKTGTLDSWNLLSAKDVVIGDTTVRLYASVLGQPDDAARLEASRALYAGLEQELQLKPSVAAGTVTGRVDTLWGDPVDIVTSGDASVVLWNGGAGTVQTSHALGDGREAGDRVGTLAVTGPLNSTTVELELAGDIEEPSPWWRLTHPLDLFGLNG